MSTDLEATALIPPQGELSAVVKLLLAVPALVPEHGGKLLGARPSNRCHGHTTSCCAPTMVAGETRAGLGDRPV